MKAIKKLLNTKTKLIVAIVVAVLLVTYLLLLIFARDTALSLLEPLLWSLVVIAVCWLGIHFGLKYYRRKKRSEFDEKVTAKEGIEDRRREWATWMDELENHGIDRYELPFYLLVGEPQSGKSVLLHNSDLHFPFGQNRLSGVGGTRGCDWWFTEEAVILDLAGRLFTHEGGAADRVEYEAFLDLLADFRPLCPANGVILVVPCDSLLSDDEDTCTLKATKIQNALLSLTTKLAAQLPVYLVLTKGDQVFGFAESVHRLDVDRRHEMFGWSRPAESIDSPFDIKEALNGFDEMVRSSRLLRAHMLAGARLPEALPEVDRMYAFPHELEGLRTNLEVYLKRIFTSSNITDRVFFRGLYLTSGLQAGVPIAKVCSELFGATGEADQRHLEALFSKPKAYFIKDLIRTRIFGERGLVRPTQGRVQQSKRAAVLGYGFAGLVIAAALIFSLVHLIKDKDQDRVNIYAEALAEANKAVANPPESLAGLLHPLHLLADAGTEEVEAAEKAFYDTREDFKRLYCHLFDLKVVPTLKQEALRTIEARLERGFASHAEMQATCRALVELTEDLDFRRSDTREAILALLSGISSTRKTPAGTEDLTLERAFQFRMSWDAGIDTLLMTSLRQDELSYIQRLSTRALAEIENSMNPGARTQPAGAFGYMLAWMGAEKAQESLSKSSVATSGSVLALCEQYSNSMAKLNELEPQLGASSAGKRTLHFKDCALQAARLRRLRDDLLAFSQEDGGAGEWAVMVDYLGFVSGKFANHADNSLLSSLGLQFGTNDAGQTLFVATEDTLGRVKAEFTVGTDADENPQVKLRDRERGLLEVSDARLPSNMRLGGLAGLSEHITRLHDRILGAQSSGAAVDVFQGQVIEAGRLFREQIGEARDAVVGVSGSSEVPRGLSFPMLVELVNLHQILGRLIADKRVTGLANDDTRRWQQHVERLLYEHLQESERDRRLEWVPALDPEIAPEAWEMLEGLGKAAKLQQVASGTYSLDGAASRLQSKIFFHLADQLLEQWASRPEELRETIAITDSLDKLAGKVVNLSNREDLDARKLSEWSDQVDNLLRRHLQAIEKALAEIWKPRLTLSPFSATINEALRALEDINEKIALSQDAGVVGLEEVVADLSGESYVKQWLSLPNSEQLVLELAQWKIPDNGNQVERQTEFRALKDSLEGVRSALQGQGGGKAYSVAYANYFRVAQSASPAENAGIVMVREIRSQFARALRTEIRDEYLSELQDMMTSSKYDRVHEALFWTPEAAEEREFRFKDVEKDIGELFRRSAGDFDKLRKEFSLIDKTGEGGIEAEVFPAKEAEDEGPWAAVHRFLLALREFMLPDDARNLRDAKITFELVPVVESGSVWDLQNTLPKDRRSSFWCPEGGSQGRLQKEFLGPGLDRIRVNDWSLDEGRSGRSFLLLWSDKPEQGAAQADPNAYRFEVESALGPLLLAWSGDPLNEEDGKATEFDVSLEPEGTEMAASLEIHFEDPLPLRPDKP